MPILIFPSLSILLPSICKCPMRSIGKKQKGYFGSEGHFSLGSIIVQVDSFIGWWTPLLVGFPDSNWVGDLDDKKPTISYVFNLGSELFTWACKKKSSLALSST